jgi:hypothetical protein
VGNACQPVPIWYQDFDSDGFGTNSDAGNNALPASVASCSQPAGYVSSNNDCCDTDNVAHPGQNAFLTTADNCNSFDYNCDGTQDAKLNGPSCDGGAISACGGTVPACAFAGSCGGCQADGGACVSYGQAACGKRWTVAVFSCLNVLGTCLEATGNNQPGGTQACN